ncbi:Crp/Fnr family transcriptional regulator [Phaeovulum sp. W22_SRMD_FR3]|uniref:Crp/Fnr family transcriptional regulator n=1 Tax=Phaeovulum sp. W22_SRMD_FR3 TaxID=3240274 RepID=UPI003F9A046A
MKNATRYPQLMKCRLLHGLTDAAKNDFLDRSIIRVYDRDQQVLTQGDHSPGLFLVAHGLIEVGYLTDTGQQSIIHHAGPGETVGEPEAVAGTRCVANCVAKTGTTLLFCPTAQIFEFLLIPQFISNFTAAFCERMQRENVYKSVDQLQPVEQRICSYLRKLSQRSPVIEQSQTYLAGVVGCSRQTVNRTLGVLRDAGIVEVNKGVIRVLNPQALEARGRSDFS